MKIAIVLFLLAVAAVSAWSQDNPITVKQSSVSGDVIVVSVQVDGKTQELHCNKSTLFCAAPEPGSYTMVRLPKTGASTNAATWTCTRNPPSRRAITSWANTA
jgi:hypothetical protein